MDKDTVEVNTFYHRLILNFQQFYKQNVKSPLLNFPSRISSSFLFGPLTPPCTSNTLLLMKIKLSAKKKESLLQIEAIKPFKKIASEGFQYLKSTFLFR